MPLYEAKRVWDLLLTKWIKVVGEFTHLTWKHYTAWKVWRSVTLITHPVYTLQHTLKLTDIWYYESQTLDNQL
jgi:hypothetical protein